MCLKLFLFLPRSAGRVGAVPGRVPTGHPDVSGQLPGVRGVTRRREPVADEGTILHRGAATAPARLEALHLHARHGARGLQHLRPGLGECCTSLSFLCKETILGLKPETCIIMIRPRE
ncbi:hypothetical protein CDAR_580931 [Caerostris darwini]|uniref:Secreted protein n=1 Tax=Caerostris darwini TaxID=1538125 RepID=A0AAV4SDR3_9ARAC|nr:hypothetical protein CDAR_580931 [Caerostris darwini]